MQLSEHPPEQKTLSVSNVFESGLKNLREQVKNVMIPLLIQIFQMRLKAQEMTSPPSRLQSKEPEDKIDELRSQLLALDEDLQMMMAWLESSRSHIDKVLAEIDSAKTSQRSIRPGFSTSPNIQKSFSEVMVRKQNDSQDKIDSTSSLTSSASAQEKFSLWSRLFSR